MLKDLSALFVVKCGTTIRTVDVGGLLLCPYPAQRLFLNAPTYKKVIRFVCLLRHLRHFIRTSSGRVEFKWPSRRDIL